MIIRFMYDIEKKSVSQLKFIFPYSNKHARIGALLDFMFLTPVMLLPKFHSWIIVMISLLFILLGLMGLPRRLYFIMLKKEYYSGLERELPYLIAHILITSSSGLSIDEVFQQAASSQLYKWFKIEAEKFLLLMRIGKPIEEALTVLLEQSSSRRYSRFLKGLLATISSSGEVPSYAYESLKEVSRELEEGWKRYWMSLNSIVEISLLIGLSVMTMSFVSFILSEELMELISYTVSGAVIITSIVLYASASSMRPLSSEGRFNNYSLYVLVSSAVSFIFLLLLSSRLPLWLILLLEGSIMLAFSMPVILYGKRKKLFEEKLFEEFRKIIGLHRIGFSLDAAIGKTRYKHITRLMNEKTLFSFRSIFIVYLLTLIQELGGSVRGLLENIYYFLNELRWLEKTNRRNALFLEILSILLPGLMYFFSVKTFSNLTQSNIGGAKIVFDDILILPFSMIAVFFNLVITLLLDDVFSLSRAGLGIIILGMACFFSPL